MKLSQKIPSLNILNIIIFERNIMSEHYYNVSYIDHENGQIKDSDYILMRSTTHLSVDQIKDYIRMKINNPKAFLTISKNEKIDKETFLSLGGTPVAPWLED